MISHETQVVWSCGHFVCPFVGKEDGLEEK